MKKSHLRRLRTSAIIITSIMLYASLSNASQKSFQLPPLFQQHEIKGNHAGMQVLAMGVLRQCMRNDGFRRYAQERVRSETQMVVNHLVGHAQPSCLSEEGEIPSDRILPSNGVGDCSLYFYKGKYNIKRKGQIKRIPRGDVDSTLSQLDDKTINHYLSIAKIAMSRCSDDSIMLRSHLDLKGGAWQFYFFNSLMWTIQGGVRLAQAITLREGIHSVSLLAERGYNYLRGGAAQAIRPHLSETGQQMARGLTQALEGMAGPVLNYVQQYGSTPVEMGVTMVQNLGQAAVETGISAFATGSGPGQTTARDIAQTALGNTTNVIGQAFDSAGRLMYQLATNGGGSAWVYAAADVLHNSVPEVTQEVAVNTIVNAPAWAWLAKLLEFTWIVRL